VIRTSSSESIPVISTIAVGVVPALWSMVGVHALIVSPMIVSDLSM
jgi:hypothetical protein